MAKAQDMEELQNLQMYMQNMQMLPPDYFEGTIKLEDFPQYIADKMGIPQKLLRNKAEQDKMKEQIARVTAAQGGINGGTSQQ